jgi:triacylglycerol lipase
LLAFALALIAVLLVAAIAVVLLRRRVAPPPAAPLEGLVPVPGEAPRGPPLPVVLVHGLFGFDRIGMLHYFRGIANHLESLGCHAHAVRLPRAASVPERAARLVELIEGLGHPRVDVIAHSLGGLDARYALSKLGLSSRVRALVTVGTPHHGTPLAAIGEAGVLRAVRKVMRLFGIKALDWLSPAALERFNAEVPDAPGVRYTCVVGGIRAEKTGIPLALSPVHHYLRQVAGPNDGLVPLASQVWGEVLAEIEADHFAQVGWRFTVRSTFDAAALYAWIVARLGDVAPERAIA